MKAILFVAENLFGPRLWVPFFDKVKSEMDTKVYCLAPSFAHVNDDRGKEVVDEIFPIGEILAGYGNFAGEFDDEAVHLARDFEHRYAAHLMDVIQGDRHLGRGTYYLGHHHPRTRNSRLSTLGRSIRYLHHMAAYLEEFVLKHNIDTFITCGVGSDFTKVMCIIAHKHGIDIRIPFSSRSGQLFTWYTDEYFGHSILLERFDFLRRKGELGAVGQSREKTVNQADVDVWNRSFRQTKLGFALKRSFWLIVGELKFLVASHTKYRGMPRFNRYLLTDNIKHLLKIPRQWKDVCKRVTPAGMLNNRRYVYYALQVEPEISTTVWAPEFNNQIAIIDVIAKSLPADVLFVVKEHMPAVGRRPDDFYEWLEQIPNVRIAHPASDGPTLACNASVVIALTGTVGIEAASEGVPVISFGRHNTYNAMRHVHVVEGLFGIRDLLQNLLSPAQAESRALALRRSEGRLFMQALEDVSFDIGDDVMVHGDQSVPVRDETIDGLYRVLMQGLGKPKADTAKTDDAQVVRSLA